MPSKVIVLMEGYAFTDNGVYRAAGSSTLIKGKINVLVDTGGAWEKDKLVSKLKENNVSCEDIHVLVGTHGHSDHIGNLNLFPSAKHIIGFDINERDRYIHHDFKGLNKYILIDNEIDVIPTPGHTHSDVSVIVYNVESLGTVGLCGDLFESEFDDGVWQAVSEDIESQTLNREKMKTLCDYIIPGHGPMFQVYDSFKKCS